MHCLSLIYDENALLKLKGPRVSHISHLPDLLNQDIPGEGLNQLQVKVHQPFDPLLGVFDESPAVGIFPCGTEHFLCFKAVGALSTKIRSEEHTSELQSHSFIS